MYRGLFIGVVVIFLLQQQIRPSSSMSSHPSFLSIGGNDRIAYHAVPGDAEIGVVFCNGFRSDMKGRKAIALERYCRTSGRSFVRFDYRGHGESSGDFLELTIGDWLEDVLDVLDNLTDRPQLLIGSSMGGWLALLAAMARPDRVAGVVGIAAAPDFTQDLWNEFSQEQKHALKENGVVYLPSKYSIGPYPISYKLIEDGRRHCLLNQGELISVKCSVTLIHGQQDSDVPWQRALDLSNRLESETTSVVLIKRGDHRLSEQTDLDQILSGVDSMLRSMSATI
jgi:pimeloyl-ACP methyl ester carboxylesterase